MDDPCYDIGGGVPPIGIKVKDPTWVISRATSGVIPTFVVVSIKMQDSSVNHLPQCNPLYQKKHTFYENWWQRGRDCTKIWKLWERLRQRSRGWTWTWTKREQHWRIERDQNSWTKEKHTSRGSKLMNFDWLHLICAYSCACLHCISFSILICMPVCCMLVIELEWWYDNQHA